jgi:hypothetical protein
MADSNQTGIERSSDGGISGSHARGEDLVAVVAPTVSAESNRVLSPIIPVACWSVGDIRFDFASSFVRPSVAEEIAQLAALRDQHKREISETVVIPAPVSIFGHADRGCDD